MPTSATRLPVFVCRVDRNFVTPHVEPNAKGPEPLQLAAAMERKRRLNRGHAGPPYRVIDSAGVTITDHTRGNRQPLPSPPPPVRTTPPAPAPAPTPSHPPKRRLSMPSFLSILAGLIGPGTIADVFSSKAETPNDLQPGPPLR